MQITKLNEANMSYNLFAWQRRSFDKSCNPKSLFRLKIIILLWL